MTNNIYSQLANSGGAREVVATGTTVSSIFKKDTHHATITTTYLFKGNSKVTKQTTNLLERTSSTIKLSKIEIVRGIDVKNVTIDVRFLSYDDILLYSETDKNIVIMSDYELLKQIGITVE